MLGGAKVEIRRSFACGNSQSPTIGIILFWRHLHCWLPFFLASFGRSSPLPSHWLVARWIRGLPRETG